MNTKRVVKSTCELCNAGCGVLVYLENDNPVKVEGNPEHPINRGAICIKGKASIEILNHPDRLKYPLKRAGERGEGKWQRINWDEALDTIASELNRIKNKYGAESVTFIRGAAKGYQDSYLSRFAFAFGSPNVSSMAPICHVPRNHASVFTYGYLAIPDYEYPPELIVIWGVNAAESAIGDARRTNEALDRGAKLLVIDPLGTGYAKKADIWVKPRPTSDLALALGMINVIVNEGLYDRDFVDNWTVGFDKLQAHVQNYSPEKVAEITWVPADTIRKIARFYATTKPACIAWGNGIDNNINNFQSARAISILRAITGNIGKPGGDIEWTPAGVLPKNSPDLRLDAALSSDQRSKWLNVNTGMLKNFFYALPQSIVKATLESDPYPVRAAFIQGGSLLHTYTNALNTYEALKSLDFLVVTDFFMIPTAELADIVLPVGTFLEIDHIHPSECLPAASIIQKVAQVGECWSDCKIYIELARRIGLGEYFWENDEQVLDYLLKPRGLSFEEFRNIAFFCGDKQYRSYEKNGFKTPSGKAELYCSKLEEWGFDPLPVYREHPESPQGNSNMAQEYPLVFTNRKRAAFQHSGGRQITELRNTSPEPLVHINPETAKKFGINEGDSVYIETKRGRIKQKASLAPDIDGRVVIADYGWWFPEKSALEDLHGWAEANINILTDDGDPCAREMGSATMRGIVCKVYKAD